MNKYTFCYIFLITFFLYGCSNMPETKIMPNQISTEKQPEIEENDNNCYLSKIDYSCGFLSPDFNKEIYNYTLFIPQNIEDEYIEIIPTTESPKATVTEKFKKQLYYIDSEYIYFTVKAENSLTKQYSIKISRYDRNIVFSYSWSLDTKQITVTNLSKQKSYFILATSTPIIHEENWHHDYALREINEELKPSETKILDAYQPTNLTSKPSIIFSTDKGSVFEYSGDFTELLFLDYRETYNGEISTFSKMYSISEQEDKYGNYSTFSWTNRNKGQYTITGNENKQLMKAYIGNITGVTHSGDEAWLKAIRYFIGEKTKWNEWKNNITQQ